MDRVSIEVSLEEKLIELLKASITFDSRSNRNKTYSLLFEASQKRSEAETRELILLIDKQIRSFEVDSIKNFFKENSSKFQVFKDEIDSFIRMIDKKNIKKSNENVSEVKENKEYTYYTNDNFEDNHNKLTREEIDGFIKNIDDKLAELEAEAYSLENKNQ